MKSSNSGLYTSGDYLQNNPTWHIEDAKWKAALVHKILVTNNLHPNTISEIGCGAGGVLFEISKLNPLASTLNGYDISPQAISLASTFTSDRLNFYNEDYFLQNNADTDALLMIDVLEHVEDYIGFLKKLRSRSKYFVFHIPLDLCCRTILKPHVLYQQRQSVGHIHYFSKEIIEWSLKDAGYTIVDQFYTKPVIDKEPAVSFKRLIKKKARNLSFSIYPDWSAKYWGGYSIMFLLR